MQNNTFSLDWKLLVQRKNVLRHKCDSYLIQVVYSLNWYDIPIFMKKIIIINYQNPKFIFQSFIFIYQLGFYAGRAFYSLFNIQFDLKYIFRRELEKINQ